MESKHREVVESDKFKTEKTAIHPDVTRWDVLLDGITWQLTRDPSREPICKRAQGSNKWAITTDEFPDAPAMIVYYVFDDNQVELLSIQLAEED